MSASLSMRVVVGNEEITVTSPDLRELIRTATAIKEMSNDALLLKQLGARHVYLNYRKARSSDGKEYDYYDMVGDNGLRISMGVYNPPESGTIPLFPGGFAKLYNPQEGKMEDLSDGDLQKIKKIMKDAGNDVYSAGSFTEAKQIAFRAMKDAVNWPSELRKELHSDYIQKAFELRRTR